MIVARRIFSLVWLLLPVLSPAADFDTALKQLVAETYQLDEQAYEITVISSAVKVETVEPSELTFRAFSQKEPLGPFTIRVEVTRDKQVIDQGQVRLRINRFAEVLVSTDKIRRHQVFAENKFEVKRMNVTSLREQPVVSTAEISGQRSRRNLRRGSILTTGAMEPVPDIDVGEEVTIVLDIELCRITVPGRTMQSGCKGETVRVKNKATGKMVMAIVVDGRTVRIDP